MSIASSIGNNLTTNGVFTASAVNNTSVNNVTDFASVPGGGALKLISTQTASASANISFTSGIDSTYDSYVFKFIDIHPQNDNVDFQFNLSTDGGSNYNVTKTTTFFRAYHGDAGGEYTALNYEPSRDLAQSTSFQNISRQMGADSDHSCSGYLHLYNPSSTTYVKHFISRCNNARDLATDYTKDSFMAGYFNDINDIDAVKFQMSSGNIDAGEILLFGVN